PRKPPASAFPAPRAEALELSAGVHGAVDFAELQGLGLRPEDVLDFSANTNPYGPAPSVQKALRSVALADYPDRACGELTAALVEWSGIAPERILWGNGVSELIWLTALAFVRSDDLVLVIGPTFCEYARSAGVMGARITEWRAREETGFIPDPAEIAATL